MIAIKVGTCFACRVLFLLGYFESLISLIVEVVYELVYLIPMIFKFYIFSLLRLS